MKTIKLQNSQETITVSVRHQLTEDIIKSIETREIFDQIIINDKIESFNIKINKLSLFNVKIASIWFNKRMNMLDFYDKELATVPIMQYKLTKDTDIFLSDKMIILDDTTDIILTGNEIHVDDHSAEVS